MQEILIAHPLKHHVFPLAAGIQRSGVSTQLITPFYRKGFGRMVAMLPGNVGKQAAGYQYNGLDSNHVISPLAWQLRKLQYGRDSESLIREFDEYVSARIARGDFPARVLVTMQDYLPKSVQAGKKAGMLIWSDQILNSSRSATDRMSTHYQMTGIKSVTVHDESANDAILHLADIVTVPSQYTLSGIADRVRASASLHVVPYGVDNRRFDIQRHRAVNTVRIIARSNSIRKGGHLLLEAISKCGDALIRLAHGRNVEVIIIGTMEQALGERLRSANFPSGINVRSLVVPHMSMPQVLASANLFVMPSLSESMSLICIEAMQAGLPLVITPYCGIDCFEHMCMGVETSDNTDALIESLLLAFRNADRWPEWGRRAAEAAGKLGWGMYERAIAQTVHEIRYLNRSNSI